MTGEWTRYFQLPWLLPLALLLPAVVVGCVLAWGRRRAARVARLGDPALVARLTPERLLVGVRGRAARLGAAAFLGGVALAGPRWGLERNVVRSSGIDVVVAVDASLSMLAPDERPTRLERAKQEVRRLRALAPGDRTALVAFAGRSYILTPLTTDAGALNLFLDNLDPSVVGQAGSSLARAIRQSTELLQSTKSGSDRAIVVLSDGEGFEPVEDVRTAAEEAAQAGIALVTVGFGTPAGSTIPVRVGTATTTKRDADGNVVVTRYEPALLQAAAQAARGTFIPAQATDKAARVRAALAGLKAQRRALDAGQDLTPRFAWFLAPAVLLLLLDTWRTGRPRRTAVDPAAGEPVRGNAARAARRTAPPAAAALLLVAVAALGACAPGAGAGPRAPRWPRVLAWPFGAGRAAADSANDEALGAYVRGEPAVALAIYRDRARGGAPLARYNLGTTLVTLDSLDAARPPLDEARRAPDAEVRWRAHFNLGLVALRRGLASPGDSGRAELDAALGLYKRALLARPRDADAKWNYELALRRRQGGGGGGGGGGQDDQKAPPQEKPQSAGGLGQRQAEELLNAAAREERDVEGKRQRQLPPPPPTGGKDW